ncbi:hypothetical protein [Nocardioides sp. NPDC127503]
MSEKTIEEPGVVAEPEDERNPDDLAGDYVDDVFVAEEDKEGF